MPIYFKLSCLQQSQSKSVMTVVGLILMFIGIEHFGYVGTVVHLLQTLKDPIYGGDATLFNTEDSLFIPLAVYFGITALVQLLAGLLIILALTQCYGKNARSCGTKFLLSLLIFNLALNIGYGAITGMNITFYNQVWLNFHTYLDTNNGNLFKVFLVYARYTLAEAVIAFALTLPLTIVSICAILTPIINLEDRFNPFQQKSTLADQMNELSTR